MCQPRKLQTEENFGTFFFLIDGLLQTVVEIMLKQTYRICQTSTVDTEENMSTTPVRNKKVALLTKVSRHKDVIDAALTSGVIVGVVWGQHSSL